MGQFRHIILALAVAVSSFAGGIKVDSIVARGDTLKVKGITLFGDSVVALGVNFIRELNNKLGLHATADSALGSLRLGGYTKTYYDTVGNGANRNRVNHTGTQAISTVTNLQSSLDGKLGLHAKADSSVIADSVKKLPFNISYWDKNQTITGAKTFTQNTNFGGHILGNSQSLYVYPNDISTTKNKFVSLGYPSTGIGANVQVYENNHATHGGDLLLYAGDSGSIAMSGNTVVSGSHTVTSYSDNTYNGNMHSYKDVLHFATVPPAVSYTGTCKIVLPKTWSNTILRIKITGYDYIGSTGAWECVIGGYNSSSGTGSWINYSAEIRGRAPFTTVRLGHDGTYCVILLGNTSTSWSYPQVAVSECLTGYANQSGWGTGWGLSFITSEAGIGSIVTPFVQSYSLISHNHGTGTTNYLPVFTNGPGGTLGNSILVQDYDASGISQVRSTKGFTTDGYLQAGAQLYTRSDIQLLNKAGSNWNVFAQRDVTNFTDAVFNLANIGNADMQGQLAFVDYTPGTPNITGEILNIRSRGGWANGWLTLSDDHASLGVMNRTSAISFDEHDVTIDGETLFTIPLEYKKVTEIGDGSVTGFRPSTPVIIMTNYNAVINITLGAPFHTYGSGSACSITFCNNSIFINTINGHSISPGRQLTLTYCNDYNKWFLHQ